MKVFIEEDEEEAPLSPMITSKEFKKQQKNIFVEAKKGLSIQVLAEKSDILPNLSTGSVAEPLENTR